MNFTKDMELKEADIKSFKIKDKRSLETEEKNNKYKSF